MKCSRRETCETCTLHAEVDSCCSSRASTANHTQAQTQPVLKAAPVHYRVDVIFNRHT